MRAPRNIHMCLLSQIVLFSLFVLILGSCAAKKRIDPVPKTTLTDVDTMKKLENMPFQHSAVYIAPQQDRYTAVYVRPIRIDTLPAGSWQNSMSSVITSKQDFYREAKAYAEYFQSQLKKSLSTHPRRRYRVVSYPGPRVVVLSVALTELEFSHPVARAGALVAPVPGAGPAVAAITDPHAAFALRITDGQSGQLLATVADRKFSPFRIVDLNKLTVTSSVREIAQNWSTELADAIQGGQFSKVEGRGKFKLLPW